MKVLGEGWGDTGDSKIELDSDSDEDEDAESGE